MHLPITYWGWRRYASGNQVIIGSGNGLSPIQRKAIIWTNNDILSIEPPGKKTSGKFESKHVDLHSTKWIWNIHCQNARTSYIFINAYILSMLSIIYSYESINKFWTSCLTLSAAPANALCTVWCYDINRYSDEQTGTCKPQCRYDAASVC